MNERQALSALWVHGDDAASFLNGQLTVNVASLHQQWRVCAYCSHQGKVIAVIWVLDWVIDGEKGYLLILPAELSATVAERLKKFTLRSKVSIEALPINVTFAGASHRQSLEKYKRADVSTFKTVTHDNDVCITDLVGIGDALIQIDLNTTEKLADAQKNWRGVNQTAITSGVAFVYAATSEQFVPQMLGLHAVGGLDFEKGCYVGQEIIARMHYKGQVRKHLTWADAATGLSEMLTPNTSLYCDKRKVATILTYVEDNEKAVVQAVINDGYQDKPLYLADNEQHQFIFMSERTSL